MRQKENIIKFIHNYQFEHLTLESLHGLRKDLIIVINNNSQFKLIYLQKLKEKIYS